jgi:4-aminobutyrate aminotransferase-like enzyme
MRSGPYNNSVRFLMPLSIAPADFEEGLRVVEEAFGGVT